MSPNLTFEVQVWGHSQSASQTGPVTHRVVLLSPASATMPMADGPAADGSAKALGLWNQNEGEENVLFFSDNSVSCGPVFSKSH